MHRKEIATKTQQEEICMTYRQRMKKYIQPKGHERQWRVYNFSAWTGRKQSVSLQYLGSKGKYKSIFCLLIKKLKQKLHCSWAENDGIYQGSERNGKKELQRVSELVRFGMHG